MKKNGFTLAEVLITLAIIGVVATLTLPALMTNTNEQQSITGMRKIINTLNEAGQMNAAVNGFDYSISDIGTADDDVADSKITLWALFNDRLQVNKQTSGGYTNSADTENNMCKGADTIALMDNTAICLPDGTAADDNNDYWNIYVDTNGTKGPNVLSTCKEEGCTTKSDRLIRDQFAVVLSRGMAYPGHWDGFMKPKNSDDSYAARYAMGYLANPNGGAEGED